ncbi:MAG TPA: isoaspartyl peptidase/L-asparaginase, partial [Sphingomonadales bacterium]|nr:isoaspartyl peptidase/L-asparaginase [Sphingomonadales bacterium]
MAERKKRFGFGLQLILALILAVIAILYFMRGGETPVRVVEEEEKTMPSYALVIHGGAGTILPSNMTPEREKAYREALAQALAAGEDILKSGGTAIEAVEASILVMEDSELFNAGKGAVYNSEGEHELDAAIMDGATLNSGAVAGVKRIKNPILLAHAVMDKSRHVMLIGDGAEEFATENGFELVDPSYFDTDYRLKQLEKAKASGNALMLESDDDIYSPLNEKKYGTVGAVALDTHGNLAAGTSTGGLTNKRWGRVGDTPIIGAGTYADNNSCAVSGTGTGEYFIRATVARSICALMEYKGLTLEEAADQIIHG